MARDQDGDTKIADTILQSLATRPNVRSTLILSRKDGSIIKASGSIVEDTTESPRHNRIHSATEAISTANTVEKGESASTEENLYSKTAEFTASSTQVLAESIYNFVTSAAAVVESLAKIEAASDSLAVRTEASKGTPERSDSSLSSVPILTDNDVQLLRLRLKKQEVIIFPDPKYLCCIVQDMDKNTR